MTGITLFELNEFIRRVIALNFSDPIWVSCEIAEVNLSRGHFFLELIQNGEEEVPVAQTSAVIWSDKYRRLRRLRGKQLDQLLQAGLQVLLYVRVDFHERYGIKLIIEDIDPAYTIGQLEIRRRKIMEKLQEEHLEEKNARLPLPPVIQRIAILSTEEAAGYRDFCRQLQSNPYEFKFDLRLFPTAVQGEQVEKDLLQQMRRIEHHRENFDIAILIRGGGARLDLLAFDSLPLARAVAHLSLPLLTGIGHDQDQTVLDQVAHTALKTPTAVADFIVHHNAVFEHQLQELGAEIRERVQLQLKAGEFYLLELLNQIQFYTHGTLQEARSSIDHLQKELPIATGFCLRSATQQLDFLDQIYQMLGPEATLRRGYSMTSRNGILLVSPEQIKPGEKIQTQLAAGILLSTIIGTDELKEN